MWAITLSIHSFIHIMLLLFGMVQISAAADLHLAPIWQWQDAEDRILWRGLGPVLQGEKRENDAEFMAIRPFWSMVDNPKLKLRSHHLLWPLGSSTLIDKDLNQRLALAIHQDRDIDNPNSLERWWLLPIYFHGQSETGESYTAIFPLGGQIQDIAGVDEVEFWLFPLYLAAQKDEIHSTHILWPIFAKIEGPGLLKLRVFPLWGQATKENSWKNNFVLWPFFHWGKNLKENASGNGFFFFPVYGRLNYENPEAEKFLEHHTFLWPFFSITHNESSDRYHLPWPFFQKISSHDGHQKRLYLWPLWGRNSQGENRYEFYLWPLYHHQTDKGALLTIDRRFVLPFYWSFTEKTEAITQTKYQRLWPLYSHHHDHMNEKRLFRVLDLWPQRWAEPIDRNWSPFWTLYTYNRDRHQRRHDLLWGLYQYHRDHDNSAKKISFFPLFHFARNNPLGTQRFDLLTGLYSRSRDNEAINHRIFWFIKF